MKRCTKIVDLILCKFVFFSAFIQDMNLKHIVRAIFYSPISIYFNLRYLPFCKAIKLPILLGGGKMLKIKGLVNLEGRCHFGMIKLGFGSILFYEKNLKMIVEGKITFKGKCSIGNACSISVAKGGHLIFGNNFSVSAGLRIACHKKIEFGHNTLVGWGCTFLDSDMHAIKDQYGKKCTACAPIIIGHDNWICQGCTILKGASTPPWTIVASNTLLSRNFSNSHEKILIGGNPAKVLKEGVWHDFFDDVIDS